MKNLALVSINKCSMNVAFKCFGPKSEIGYFWKQVWRCTIHNDIFHEGQIKDKETACRARTRITPLTKFFSYFRSIFVWHIRPPHSAARFGSHIRPKYFRFLWFVSSLVVGYSVLLKFFYQVLESKYLMKAKVSTNIWLWLHTTSCRVWLHLLHKSAIIQ